MAEIEYDNRLKDKLAVVHYNPDLLTVKRDYQQYIFVEKDNCVLYSCKFSFTLNSIKPGSIQEAVNTAINLRHAFVVHQPLKLTIDSGYSGHKLYDLIPMLENINYYFVNKPYTKELAHKYATKKRQVFGNLVVEWDKNCSNFALVPYTPLFASDEFDKGKTVPSYKQLYCKVLEELVRSGYQNRLVSDELN